jgi:hypothetical protein
LRLTDAARDFHFFRNAPQVAIARAGGQTASVLAALRKFSRNSMIRKALPLLVP